MPYALGLAFGASFWCLFALFGLTVLFRVLPQSYQLLRLLGGAYLLWIAIQMWRHASMPMTILEGSAGGPGFVQGLALEEVRRERLGKTDRSYPVVVTVRAVKRR